MRNVKSWVSGRPALGLIGLGWACLVACATEQPSEEPLAVTEGALRCGMGTGGSAGASQFGPTPEQRVNIDLELTEGAPYSSPPGTTCNGADRWIQPTNPAQGQVKLWDDAKGFPIALAGSAVNSYSLDNTYINPNFHYGATGSALQLTLPGRAAPPLPGFADRVELIAFGSDFATDYGVYFDLDHPNYFGFAMYIPSSSCLGPNQCLETGGELLFMQAWQYNVSRAPGGRCGVPLYARLHNVAGSGGLEARVYANDDAGADYTVGVPIPISTNAWHTFLFRLEPNNNSQTGDGSMTLWFDGGADNTPNGRTLNWEKDWGCNLGQNGSLPEIIPDQWHLRVGMYRANPTSAFTREFYTFFDNVRIASKKSLANPSNSFGALANCKGNGCGWPQQAEW